MRNASSAHRIRRAHFGFTLVELMIVVAIVGILTAIAYPAYIDYVWRAKRAEAKALLSDVSARLERYYFDNNSYTTDVTLLGFPTAANAVSAEKNYIATVGAGGGNIATYYIITAAAASGKPTDPKCGSLTLDSRGAKDVSVSGAADNCWR